MIKIGNFFFRFRNYVFPLAILLVLIPSPPLFPDGRLALALGLLVIVCGQGLRAMTIGLAYIKRGGREKRVYADGLVCDGLFAHCRNPLYVGNILMLLGFGVALNSRLCLVVGGACFLFIYSAIVRAEENFLRGKFGAAFEDYCRAVPRWRVRLAGLGATLRSMQFHWRRLLVKEYGTCFNWLAGLPIAFYLQAHLVATHDFAWTPADTRLLVLLAPALAFYGVARFLKKARIVVAD